MSKQLSIFNIYNWLFAILTDETDALKHVQEVNLWIIHKRYVFLPTNEENETTKGKKRSIWVLLVRVQPILTKLKMHYVYILGPSDTGYVI